MIDAEYYFRRWMEGLDDLANIVGRRICKSPLPMVNKLPLAWNGARTPAVTYHRSGGESADGGFPVVEPVMTLMAWGVDEDAALKVFAAVVKPFEDWGGDRQVVAGKTLVGFEQVSPEVGARDEESKLWFVAADFTFAIG